MRRRVKDLDVKLSGKWNGCATSLHFLLLITASRPPSRVTCDHKKTLLWASGMKGLRGISFPSLSRKGMICLPGLCTLVRHDT